MVDGGSRERFRPVVGGHQIRVALWQLDEMKDEACHGKSNGAENKGRRNAGDLGDSTPGEAPGRHRAVEHREIDGKRTSTNPIRQDRLCGPVQCG
jgi:hypothetical protein